MRAPIHGRMIAPLSTRWRCQEAIFIFFRAELNQNRADTPKSLRSALAVGIDPYCARVNLTTVQINRNCPVFKNPLDNPEKGGFF
jgi:hypothetical protein